MLHRILNTAWLFLVQYTVLEVHFQSVRRTVVTRIRKYFISIKEIQDDYSVWM